MKAKRNYLLIYPQLSTKEIHLWTVNPASEKLREENQLMQARACW